MGEPTLSDITQVCRMFGISSRTLRFYEEKGLYRVPRNRFQRVVTILPSRLNTSDGF